MSDKRSEKAFIEQPGSLEEMRTLLDSQTLSQEKEHLLRAHILLATAITEMPRERVPEALLNSLYSTERSSFRNRSFVSLRDILYSLVYMTAAVAGILFINGDAVSDRSMIVYAVLLSSAFGFFFYHLFKSKFLVI